MSQPSTVLDWYLGYIHCWAVKDLGLPMWEEVFLTEEPKFEESSLKVNVGQLYLAEDYRERFTTLATNGWPWINLNVIGVSSGRLVLSVEVPGYPAEGAPFTSVNMSGPSKVVEENGFEVEVVENHGG